MRAESTIEYIPLARIKLSAAAELLGISKSTMERMVKEGFFSVQKDGNGKNCHRHLLYDELREYLKAAKNGPDYARAAVKEYRRRQGRM